MGAPPTPMTGSETGRRPTVDEPSVDVGALDDVPVGDTVRLSSGRLDRSHRPPPGIGRRSRIRIRPTSTTAHPRHPRPPRAARPARRAPTTPPPVRSDRSVDDGYDDRFGYLDDDHGEDLGFEFEAEVDGAGSSDRRRLRHGGGCETQRHIEWAVVLVGAILLALLLRAVLLQAFWIPSPSMESTLLVRDRVLVNKLSYQVGDVGRGDIVVFRRTDDEIAPQPRIAPGRDQAGHCPAGRDHRDP